MGLTRLLSCEKPVSGWCGRKVADPPHTVECVDWGLSARGLSSTQEHKRHEGRVCAL